MGADGIGDLPYATTLSESTPEPPAFTPRSARFEILRRLGAGGMGIVYVAIDKQRGARVALKTLRELDGESLFRFKREYRSVQGLQHPNLVALGDLVEEDGAWFFTMELVRGTDFLRYVRPGAALDETRLRDALHQLAAGIAFLHAAGIMHRDLKPSNVLVDETGRVVILDLGLVYDLSDAQSTGEHIVGTVAYMSPEQAAAKRLGPESDWYSVGVMLYEALTGRVPHAGTAIEVLQRKQQLELPPPSAVARGVPEDLDRHRRPAVGRSR
jgi:serine/threonine protein kinase